ncbi:DUF2235 domain-containing protein [Mycena indigotica]|uniref:ditrans,polycis-polyprenyl diphosphate synthase [(2E,6E)-farnesyldiphosphate specific] n=1 Tax=Mycena indigotica TaxID=2126181 RepID=A0A8H6SWZ3_9AGAR|nr:DUF2235 domain-containing protein [Mycena indigotica]KAF7306889.1 DUF2235 domain-containing protein [Mycena indigotica]
MRLVRYAILSIVHFVYSFISLLISCWNYSTPSPLRTTRRRIPGHLALILVPKVDSKSTRECMLETIARVVGWCRVIGVQKLTVYDSEGILVDCEEQLSRRVFAISESAGDDSESDIEYPLTPPSSDYSESRPLSPEHVFGESSTITIHLPRAIRKRASRYGLKTRPARDSQQRPLELCIASRNAGKSTLAATATSLARRRMKDPSQPSVSVEILNALLEGPNCVTAPDFLILHPLRDADHSLVPLELYGFPPWQIRLTEIYYNQHVRPIDRIKSFLGRRSKNEPRLLTEIEFRAALDEFAGAEMRFGR